MRVTRDLLFKHDFEYASRNMKQLYEEHFNCKVDKNYQGTMNYEGYKAAYLCTLKKISETVKFLEQYIFKGQSPLCGNTICQDRRFLARCMPELEEFCHYRNLDVSSIRELGKRWYFEDIDNFQKSSNHRALDDIRDSIDELRYYRKTIFKL